MCLVLFYLLLVRTCLALGPPPVITVQPLSQSAPLLGTVTFSVTVSSQTTLTYQWFFDGSSIPGATSSSYSVLSVLGSQSGTYYVEVTNAGGSVVSSNAYLNTGPPPTITSQPSSTGVAQGQDVSFSVGASGPTSLTYQWYFGSSQLGAASSSPNLTLDNVTPGNAGNYTVVVKDSYGSTTSAVATLTVYVPPGISTQPQSQTVIEGQNASFSVQATGTGPFSYQWQVSNSSKSGFVGLSDGGQISGSSSNLLQIEEVTTNDALNYRVIITSTAGAVTSSPALLSVAPSVLFDVQFLGVAGTAFTGGSGLPQTGAAILGNPGDSWNQAGMVYYIYPGTSADVNSTPLVDSANTPSGLSLTVGSSPNSVYGGHEPNATPTDPDTTNLMSSDIEQFVLNANVDSWTITIGGMSGYAGEHFNLVVYAGAPTPAIQTIALIGGASGGNTSSALTTRSTDRKLSNGAGDAYQIFTNGTLDGGNLIFTVNGGTAAFHAVSAFVNGFQLQIFSCPVVANQPASQTNVAGSTVQFSVGAEGGSLNYQWQTNGGSGYVNLEDGGIFSGANSNVLTITGAPGSSSLLYQVIVSNSGGSVTSAPAALRLTPQIMAQPASQVTGSGGEAFYSVAADGSGPLSYQWLFDGAAIPGATNAEMTLAHVQAANSLGSYKVVVSNNFGSIASAVATLTVTNPVITLSTAGGLGMSKGPGGFTFQFSVPINATYVVQASTDLLNWTPIYTNVAASATIAITDASALDFQKRYYRVMLPQ